MVTGAHTEDHRARHRNLIDLVAADFSGFGRERQCCQHDARIGRGEVVSQPVR